MEKKFDYEEARKRVEKLTGKPTYMEIEGDVEESGSEVEKVDKDYQKVELRMKANPDEGVNSTLRLTGKDGIFEERIRHSKPSKVEQTNRFEEIEDVKKGEISSELERKRLELDKKEKDAESKHKAALIDSEKYKQQAEEARKQREKFDLELKQEQRPQVHFSHKKQ